MQVSHEHLHGALLAEFDGWTAPGTPVSLAYERGYADALAFAVTEIARLREEFETLKQHSAAH